MQKQYDKGRLQVRLNDGSKRGKSINVSNMNENFEDTQIEQVTEALGTLSDFPVEGASVTQTYKYEKDLMVP